MIGFILGIFSSWLFWKWQLQVQPNFAISDKIAIRYRQATPDIPFYQIKIVNFSKRAVINMTATFGIHELSNHRGPTRKLIYSINLLPSSPTFIGPYTHNYDPWSVTNVHYYSSVSDNKLYDMLQNGRKLLFTVSATDAASGTTVIRRRIYTKEDLIEGYFEGYRSLKIVPTEKSISTTIS
ncbi:MAG: hypothetical protein ACTFAK_12355 [Candidatus Electronema sp. VV]